MSIVWFLVKSNLKCWTFVLRTRRFEIFDTALCTRRVMIKPWASRSYSFSRCRGPSSGPDVRFASSGMEPVDPQELLRGPSGGIVPFSCCDVVLSYSTALVLQLHLWHMISLCPYSLWATYSCKFLWRSTRRRCYNCRNTTVSGRRRPGKCSENSRISVPARLLQSCYSVLPLCVCVCVINDCSIVTGLCYVYCTLFSWVDYV